MLGELGLPHLGPTLHAPEPLQVEQLPFRDKRRQVIDDRSPAAQSDSPAATPIPNNKFSYFSAAASQDARSP